LSLVIKLMLKKEWVEQFPRKYSLIVYFINELAALFFIYYTAKAFLPNTELMKGIELDYFSFVLVGECFFRPLFVFAFSLVKNLKDGFQQGRLEHFLLLRRPLWHICFLEAIPSLLLEAIKIFLILLVAFFFFSLQLGNAWLIFPLWAVVALPFFFAFGLFSNAIFMMFKRGEAYIYKILQLGIILAGAYFPTTSLPEKVKYFLPYWPLHSLMQSIRHAQADTPLGDLFFAFALQASALVALGVTFSLFAIWWLKKTLKRYPYIT